jgi:hypothetical protein
VAARIVDDSAVIVLSDSGEVTVLNTVGTRVWELANGSRSVGEIIQMIEAEYEVARAQAEADVIEFLESLLKAGAVIMEDNPARAS